MTAISQPAAGPALEKRRVKQITKGLEKLHPDARLALNYRTPLQLLVALILAARARDDRVNEITAELFNRYRNARDYATAAPAKLEAQIKGLNFYRTKAKAIRNCCAHIVERYGGEVPDQLESLLTLPGVGRKTANILLGNAFGRQTIGVDTHVLRLAQRLGLTSNTDPDKIEADLLPLVAPPQRVRFCHLLQYHGRRVCVAQRPRCPQCGVRALCPYPAKTQARRG